MRSHLHPSPCRTGHILNCVLKPFPAPGNHHSKSLMAVRFFSENIKTSLRTVAIPNPATQPGGPIGVVDRDIHPTTTGTDLPPHPRSPEASPHGQEPATPPEPPAPG